MLFPKARNKSAQLYIHINKKPPMQVAIKKVCDYFLIKIQKPVLLPDVQLNP